MVTISSVQGARTRRVRRPCGVRAVCVLVTRPCATYVRVVDGLKHAALALAHRHVLPDSTCAAVLCATNRVACTTSRVECTANRAVCTTNRVACLVRGCVRRSGAVLLLCVSSTVSNMPGRVHREQGRVGGVPFFARCFFSAMGSERCSRGFVCSSGARGSGRRLSYTRVDVSVYALAVVPTPPCAKFGTPRTQCTRPRVSSAGSGPVVILLDPSLKLLQAWTRSWASPRCRRGRDREHHHGAHRGRRVCPGRARVGDGVEAAPHRVAAAATTRSAGIR